MRSGTWVMTKTSSKNTTGPTIMLTEESFAPRPSNVRTIASPRAPIAPPLTPLIPCPLRRRSSRKRQLGQDGEPDLIDLPAFDHDSRAQLGQERNRESQKERRQYP